MKAVSPLQTPQLTWCSRRRRSAEVLPRSSQGSPVLPTHHTPLLQDAKVPPSSSGQVEAFCPACPHEISCLAQGEATQPTLHAL